MKTSAHSPVGPGERALIVYGKTKYKISLGSPRKAAQAFCVWAWFSVPTEGPHPPRPAQIRPAPDRGVPDNLLLNSRPLSSVQWGQQPLLCSQRRKQRLLPNGRGLTGIAGRVGNDETLWEIRGAIIIVDFIRLFDYNEF